MLMAIFNIILGLILLSGVIGVLPGVGKHLEKAGKWLGSFQVIFGILAIILAVINIDFSSIHFWALLIGGLILAAGILETIPGMSKVIKFIVPIQVIVGIFLLIVGIIGLF